MNEPDDSLDQRRARSRKMALLLGAVALTFFIGFIVISGMR